MEKEKKKEKTSPGDVWFACLPIVLVASAFTGPAAPVALLGYAAAGVCAAIAGEAEEGERKEDC